MPIESAVSADVEVLAVDARHPAHFLPRPTFRKR